MSESELFKTDGTDDSIIESLEILAVDEVPFDEFELDEELLLLLELEADFAVDTAFTIDETALTIDETKLIKLSPLGSTYINGGKTKDFDR